MTTALTVERVTHEFGGLRALSEVTLAVGVGERRVILGPNGAGKTTLFNLITGLLLPRAGRIRLFEQDVTRLAPYHRARLGLGRTFQITTLFPRLTVLESLVLAVQGAERVRASLWAPGRVHRDHARRAEALLAEWELDDQRHVLTRELSYGDQRQVELLLALAGGPRVLLLDEPTAGLSPPETARVVAMIQRFSRDVTVLLIEHDMDVALVLADRITVLHYGVVVADGEREDVRADPRVTEIYLGADDA
jgi:branched-chain amino acid transport system ATP-binding protein